MDSNEEFPSFFESSSKQKFATHIRMFHAWVQNDSDTWKIFHSGLFSDQRLEILKNI